MDFDKLFPARFLKAGEFQGRDVTLTIAGVSLEELETARGKETKAIVSFRETKKQLVLNKTNGLCIKAMFGRETDAWIGKRVTFYPAHIQFEDNDLAIRVRGSPDIPAPITFELKLPRKKPKQTTLQVTRVGAQPRPQKPATASKPAAPAKPAAAPSVADEQPQFDEPPPPTDADMPFAIEEP
jgi:hypothetical protein